MFRISNQSTSKASQDKSLDILGTVNLRAVMFGINREITNLGLSMSIWNIKREGHFDLFESNIINEKFKL